MRLERVGRIELVYTEVDEEIPFSEGGLVYGILTGKIEGGEMQGRLHATNHARQRPDGVFTPALRGVVTTDAGARVFFTMDGLSVRDPAAQPPRRVVTVGLTFWTTDAALKPWNEAYFVAELEGGAIGESWGVVGPLYRCVAELGAK